MTNESVKRYRAALEAKQADLARALRRRNEITIEHSAEALEQTVWAAERELAVGALDRGSRMLREVREALQRLANGSYGICEDCGQCIKPKRLDAVPWTRYCVACQEEQDRNSHQPLYERPSALAA